MYIYTYHISFLAQYTCNVSLICYTHSLLVRVLLTDLIITISVIRHSVIHVYQECVKGTLPMNTYIPTPVNVNSTSAYFTTTITIHVISKVLVENATRFVSVLYIYIWYLTAWNTYTISKQRFDTARLTSTCSCLPT